LDKKTANLGPSAAGMNIEIPKRGIYSEDDPREEFI
jgi:hypothetical protein